MAEISDAVTVNRAVEFIWKVNPDLMWRFGVSRWRGGAISMPGCARPPVCRSRRGVGPWLVWLSVEEVDHSGTEPFWVV